MRHLGIYIVSAWFAFGLSSIAAGGPSKKRLSPLAQRIESLFFLRTSPENPREIFAQFGREGTDYYERNALQDAMAEVIEARRPEYQRLTNNGFQWSQEKETELRQKAIDSIPKPSKNANPYRFVATMLTRLGRINEATPNFTALHVVALNQARTEVPNAFAETSRRRLQTAPLPSQTVSAISQNGPSSTEIAASSADAKNAFRFFAQASGLRATTEDAAPVVEEAAQKYAQAILAAADAQNDLAPQQPLNTSQFPMRRVSVPQGLSDPTAAEVYAREFLRARDEAASRVAAAERFSRDKGLGVITAFDDEYMDHISNRYLEAFSDALKIDDSIFWVELEKHGARQKLTPKAFTDLKRKRPRVAPDASTEFSAIWWFPTDLEDPTHKLHIMFRHPKGGVTEDNFELGDALTRFAEIFSWDSAGRFGNKQHFAYLRSHAGLLEAEAFLTARVTLRHYLLKAWPKQGYDAIGKAVLELANSFRSPQEYRIKAVPKYGEGYSPAIDKWKLMLLGGDAIHPAYWEKRTSQKPSKPNANFMAALRAAGIKRKKLDEESSVDAHRIANKDRKTRLHNLLGTPKQFLQNTAAVAAVLGGVTYGLLQTPPVKAVVADYFPLEAPANPLASVSNRTASATPSTIDILWERTSTPSAPLRFDRIILATEDTEIATAKRVQVEPETPPKSVHRLSTPKRYRVAPNTITPIATPPAHRLSALWVNDGELLIEGTDFDVFRASGGEYFIQGRPGTPSRWVGIVADFDANPEKLGAEDPRLLDLNPKKILEFSKHSREVGFTKRPDALEKLVRERNTQSRPITHYDTDAIFKATANYTIYASPSLHLPTSDRYARSARALNPQGVSEYQCTGACQDAKLFYDVVLADHGDIKIRPRVVLQLDLKEPNVFRAYKMHTDLAIGSGQTLTQVDVTPEPPKDQAAQLEADANRLLPGRAAHPSVVLDLPERKPLEEDSATIREVKSDLARRLANQGIDPKDLAEQREVEAREAAERESDRRRKEERTPTPEAVVAINPTYAKRTPAGPILWNHIAIAGAGPDKFSGPSPLTKTDADLEEAEAFAKVRDRALSAVIQSFRKGLRAAGIPEDAFQDRSTPAARTLTMLATMKAGLAAGKDFSELSAEVRKRTPEANPFGSPSLLDVLHDFRLQILRTLARAKVKGWDKFPVKAVFEKAFADLPSALETPKDFLADKSQVAHDCGRAFRTALGRAK